MDTGYLFTVVNLPSEWPPPSDFEFFSRTSGDSEVKLIADDSGRLHVQILRSNQVVRSHVSQPVRVVTAGWVIIAARWSPTEFSLWLNGFELLPDQGPETPLFPLIGSPGRLDAFPRTRHFLGLDPSKGKDQTERLFLATISDIDSKLIEPTWYELIRAAGLLRQLFLDDPPLVHRVNRKHRQRIEFTVMDHRTPPPIVPDHHWVNLDPSELVNARTILVGLDAFLSAPCLGTGGRTASVKDLIKACANVKGGVHLGKAQTLGEQAALDWDEVVRVLGEEPTLIAIAGICRITLRGLAPLVSAIISSA